jgi:type II secretory pathway component PulF
MNLLDAIISREECTKEEAQEIINEMKMEVADGENAEDVLREYGFEPDYIFDLI